MWDKLKSYWEHVSKHVRNTMGTQWEFHWNNKNPTPKKKNNLRPLVHATSSPWLQDHYCLPMSFPIFGLG